MTDRTSGTLFPRPTPWVARLIAANVVVQLLLATLFTSPGVRDGLQFSPGSALTHPWTFVTYMFVHAGLLHLAGNMVALYFFGTPVEARMGGRAFLFYYLLCGVGAAVFSLALSGVWHVSPFLGASGAILGVALAFAIYWPDAEIYLFPIPFPIRAKTLVAVLALASAFFGLVLRNTEAGHIAHLAHLGGIIFGYLYFRFQALAQRVPAAAPRQVEHVVMVQSPARDAERMPATPVHRTEPSDGELLSAELDRVLDKISERGISGLTPEERRFLDEMARRKQRDHS